MSSEQNAVVQLRLKATSPETKKKCFFEQSQALFYTPVRDAIKISQKLS